MKATFRLLLVLTALASLVPSPTRAQDEPPRLPDYARLRRSLVTRAAELRTTVANDSTFVGHSHTNHTAGGANPWNIYTGTSRPGRGLANEASWDFGDQTGLGAGDSLQGWWPVTLPYRYGGVISTMTDHDRPWACIDRNQINYRPRNGRTFGVTGAWHSDPGVLGAGANVQAPLVRWTPLAGGRSMWCGLRALHDESVMDPVTAQPYNEQASMFSIWASNTSAAPIFRCYPGYGNQWDQILYRDFPAVNGAAMNIQFLYRTALSTSFSTGNTTRCGWFHGDPLSTSSPNFISSNDAAANAPRDSFSVYIGCPVNDAACIYTDASISPAPVFDKQRRWFDEVIRIDAPYFEILGKAGNNPADSTLATPSVNQTIPWANPGNGNACISALYNAAGNTSHRVRLAFRLKTNRSFSDDDYKSGSGVLNGGYTSLGRGGVQIDNVVVDGATFDFESTSGGVENSLDDQGNWATDPSMCWKSTGKPEPAYFHPVDVATSTWSDICGPPHSATSQCNLEGVVISIGNADQNGSIADARWPAFNEVLTGFVSPAIDFVTNPDNVTPNEMGITGNLKQATDDIYMQYEVNFAAFELANTGTLWQFAAQCYPALTANGHYAWGDYAGQPGRIYNTFPGCQADLEQFKGNSMIHTSNPNGIPDSIRVYIGYTAECFFFGGTCNSTVGGYFDNVTVILVNKSSPDPLGGIQSDIWQFFNDAFPVNGYAIDNVAAGTAAFDTTTALVKGALNIASATGDITRFDVLADSVTVSAPNGTGSPNIRVDLVFRILPGPGNYRSSIARSYPPTTSMQLLRVPTNQANVATAGDNSFWGQYLANPGQFASPGAHAGGIWDALAWNSARCDTVEGNIFPVVGKANSGVDANGNTYQSTYHESDPHYETLGILKGRCFLVNPTGSFNSTNVSCDTTFTKVPGNLVNDYELAPSSGFDGRFSTKEYTKILPDGLLTPGSHVQYFFRKQRTDLTGGFAMVPDTTTISPQLGEINFDGHRWQEFSVLPDRWKGTEFGGDGMACMLYVDNDDRRGDELVWMSTMDSIGGTRSNRWGAHNGWHARGVGFSLDGRVNPAVSSAFVNRNAQPGSVFDMYGVKASESSSSGGAHIGNRYATQPTGLMAGKGAAIGPRKAWLRTYYHMVSWLTGDLSFQNIGPVSNVGQDDIGLIEDFLTTAAGTAQPRQLFVQGDGFAEQCDANGGVHLDFLNNYLFCGLRDASYTNLTPDLVGCPDLLLSTSLNPSGGNHYGVANTCVTLNDVLEPGAIENTIAAEYQAVGANAPYRASIEHSATGTHNWHSLIGAWDLANTVSRWCGTSSGRLIYSYYVMTNAFGSVCASWSTAPFVGDVPTLQHGGVFVNFMKVGNSVVRSGQATVHFGVAKAGRVKIRLYDVTGRLVRTVADRNYEPGADYAVQWDGRDDAGGAAARGVYFARIEFEHGAPINGRVVMLR